VFLPRVLFELGQIANLLYADRRLGLPSTCCDICRGVFKPVQVYVSYGHFQKCWWRNHASPSIPG